MNITVTIEVPDDRIKGLLCSALEGGSNYWYMVEDYVLAEGLSFFDLQKGGKYWHPYEIIPLVEGCSLIIVDKNEDEDFRIELNRERIEQGLKVMAKDFPRAWADFISENDDANTGDIFLQCCCFGKLVFC